MSCKQKTIFFYFPKALLRGLWFSHRWHKHWDTMMQLSNSSWYWRYFLNLARLPSFSGGSCNWWSYLYHWLMTIKWQDPVYTTTNAIHLIKNIKCLKQKRKKVKKNPMDEFCKKLENKETAYTEINQLFFYEASIFY